MDLRNLPMIIRDKMLPLQRVPDDNRNLLLWNEGFRYLNDLCALSVQSISLS